MIVITEINETWVVCNKSTFDEMIITNLYDQFVAVGQFLDYLETLSIFFNFEREHNVRFDDMCIYSFESYINDLLKSHHRALQIADILS